MKEKKILVRPVEDSWTIDIDGQNYDLFSTEQEAMDRAARWSQNAVKQGYESTVFIKTQKGEIAVILTPEEDLPEATA